MSYQHQQPPMPELRSVGHSQHLHSQQQQKQKNVLIAAGVAVGSVALAGLGYYLYTHNKSSSSSSSTGSSASSTISHVQDAVESAAKQAKEKIQLSGKTVNKDEYKEKGKLHQTRREFPQAIAAWKEALIHEPHKHTIHSNLASCLLELKSSSAYKEALQYAEKSLQIQASPNAIGHYIRGRALAGLKRTEDALEALNHALQQPDVHKVTKQINDEIAKIRRMTRAGPSSTPATKSANSSSGSGLSSSAISESENEAVQDDSSTDISPQSSNGEDNHPSSSSSTSGSGIFGTKSTVHVDNQGLSRSEIGSESFADKLKRHPHPEVDHNLPKDVDNVVSEADDYLSSSQSTHASAPPAPSTTATSEQPSSDVTSPSLPPAGADYKPDEHKVTKGKSFADLARQIPDHSLPKPVAGVSTTEELEDTHAKPAKQ